MKEGGRELDGMGWSRWRKDKYESKERDILIEGSIMELTRNLALEKIPKNPQGRHQLRPWAVEERVSELTLP